VFLEYGSRLDAVHSQADLRLALQIEMVDQADRGARQMLEDLEARYFAGGGNAGLTDQTRVWGPVSLYCAQLEAAYVHLARQFQTYSQGWAEVHDKIPMVVARAFRATSLRLKWQLMRYLPIEKDIWQSLSQMWSFVEDKASSTRGCRLRGQINAGAGILETHDARRIRRRQPASPGGRHSLSRYRPSLWTASKCSAIRPRRATFSWTSTAGTAPERFTQVSVVRSGARFFGPAGS
jgi:hypothetical protein